jgi:hypothetical protein
MDEIITERSGRILREKRASLHRDHCNNRVAT